MAIIKITDTLISIRPGLMDFLVREFQTVKELPNPEPGIRRFSISGAKYNLPVHDAEVAINFHIDDETKEVKGIRSIYTVPPKVEPQIIYQSKDPIR